MLKSIKFLLVLIVTLFLNFSYGSLNISPNYGKFKTGDKITIIFNSNKKVNNATLSYHSIKDSFKGIDIINNVSEEHFDYTWEIPEEINNDIGYFAIWNNGNIFIERSNDIAIASINDELNLKQKRNTGAGKTGKVVKVAKGAKVKTKVPKVVNVDNVAKAQKDVNNSDNGTEVKEEKEEKEESKKQDEKPVTEVDDEKLSTSQEASTIDVNTNKVNTSKNTQTDNNSSKNDTNTSNDKSNNNMIFIIGGGAVLVIVFAIIFVRINSRKNDIPTGKRSITKRFTLRDEVVPPIKYNDSWKSTLSKNKGFNTLPSTLNRSNTDEETEQLINGDNLINDAEKFARKHGLTDTEWVARKDYIPFREDELEIYEGNRIKVFELYDDLWCYGMNLDHYGTLSNDNEGMFPSSVLPIEIITQLLNATKNAAATDGEQNNTNEVTIDCNEVKEAKAEENGKTGKNENQVSTTSQFTLPKPLAVPLMPPKPLPNIPNLNRSSSLRSSVHRKRNSNQIDPSRSPLVMNSSRISQMSNLSANRSSNLSNISVGNRHSQLSTLSNEIEINQDKSTKQKPKQSHQSKMLFISTSSSGQKESKPEDVKHLLSSPESDFQNKSTDESLSATSPINNTNLKQKQPSINLVASNNDEANTSIIRQKDELKQQQLLIQKQREQLQQQQLEQQKLQEQLKQQQLHQQLQQQQIEMQIKQLQQLQQEKERQLQQQKEQLQQQFQQQQKEQEQLRIQREQQQIIQKSKLKEIEYERELLLQNAMKKQDHRDSILPSYSEAVNTNPYNFASSSSGSGNMVEGFPLPPNMTSPTIMSPVSDNSEEQGPELYPRNASYKHQIQKRDLAPEDYPRNTSRAYVDEHPSIGRKIKQNKNEEQNSNSKEKYALKQKEAMNYQ